MIQILVLLFLVGSIIFPASGFSQEVLLHTDFAHGQLPPGMEFEYGTATVEPGHIDWQANSRLQFGNLNWDHYTVQMEIVFLDPAGRMYVHWDKAFDGTNDSYSYRLYNTLSSSTHLDDFDGSNPNHYNILQATNSEPIQVGEPCVLTFGSNYSGVFAGIDGLFDLHVADEKYRSGYVAMGCSADARINWIKVVDTNAATTAGYWRFEEGTAGEDASGGNSIVDFSDNANCGTPAGTPVYSSDVPSSVIPKTGLANNLSLEFSGGSDEVIFNSMFPFHESGDATVEFYLKINGGSLGCVLWTSLSDYPDQNRFNFQYDGSYSLLLDYRNPTGTRHALIENVPLTVDQWYHLAYVRSGNSYSLFKDGVLVGSGEDLAPDLPTSLGWTISGRNYYRVNGCVDELRFTNRALSPAEFLNVVAGEPASLRLCDIPDDQGGFLEYAWTPSLYDDSNYFEPIVSYDVQRLDLDSWVTLETIAATEAESYQVTVSTPEIFTVGEPELFSQYRVVAHSTNPDVTYYSDVASGCSLDNIAPPKPECWIWEGPGVRAVLCDYPDTPDLGQVCFYRGSFSGFAPDQPVSCGTVLNYNETQFNNYYYRAQFADIHGNQGEFSDEVGLSDISGVATTLLPDFGMEQNFPNPFNPSTTIRFSLSGSVVVSLRIYDVSGKLVRNLISDELLESGYRQQVWNGDDDTGLAVSAGVYFYKLQAGEFEDVKRMALVK
jgi:hypothetical protein